jgi:hypothetical protein
MPALREFLSVKSSEMQELQESGVRSTPRRRAREDLSSNWRSADLAVGEQEFSYRIRRNAVCSKKFPGEKLE